MSVPRPTIVLGLACVALVLGLVPFAGLLGTAVFVLAVRALRGQTGARVRLRAAISLSVIAVAMGAGWTWVYLEPPRPALRGQAPVVVAVMGDDLRSEGSFVTGSLYPWAERRELARATQLQEHTGAYALRIEGAREQTMQVDSVGLVVADHQPGVVLVPTTQEAVVSVSGSVAPLAPLSSVDVVLAGEPVRTWAVRFPRPAATNGAAPTRALLVLTARSTAFAEDAFARYLATMGQSMDPFMSWVTKETCTDACRQEVWDDETARLGIALQVSVFGAAPRSIAPVGTHGLRTFAVPIDLPAGSGPVIVRLLATPRFWEIARVALAPDSARQDCIVLAPARAELRRLEHTEDVRELVTSDDRRRAALRVGERLDLRFDAPPLTDGRERVVFIALRAHYRVPTGGRRFLNLPVIAAHRSGLISLPRFASTLDSSVENPSPDSATTTSAALSTGE